ncbi:MAG: GNAT family N-acetyltransferase [Pirellulales bacterium]
MSIELRTIINADFEAVGELIYDSTNAWYVASGRSPIFTGPKESTQLFCRVYDQIDSGNCILAVSADGQIAGSCFYHPRSTHVSLGIMNVHPNFFGQGIARKLLKHITDLADEQQLPVRLVSSAVNLDSFSLYNRAGFVPRMVFQDMLIDIPEAGIEDLTVSQAGLRDATEADSAGMAKLELELAGIERENDLRYFIKNEDGIWHVTVSEDAAGQLNGFLVSVYDPGSNMIGPGVARDEETLIQLLLAEINQQRGHQPVCVVPAEATQVVNKMYQWGAKNCELHFAQVRGEWKEPSGLIVPSFMPETG